MKSKSVLVVLAAVLVFAGCATTEQYVAFPDQSVEVEDPDRGRIYVVRPDFMGSAVQMNVTADDTLIGTTTGGGYLCWETVPGMVTITGHAEVDDSIDLSIQRGKAYYIYQAMRMGVWVARNELIELSTEKGKEYLESCSPPQVVLEE
jgi:hypothetical protein